MFSSITLLAFFDNFLILTRTKFLNYFVNWKLICLVFCFRVWKPTWSDSTNSWLNNNLLDVNSKRNIENFCFHCVSFTVCFLNERNFYSLVGIYRMDSMTPISKCVFLFIYFFVGMNLTLLKDSVLIYLFWFFKLIFLCVGIRKPAQYLLRRVWRYTVGCAEIFGNHSVYFYM